jgi:predicted methyltransferase
VFVGDFHEVLRDWPSESVDLILTDPPYGYASVALYRDLASVAARLLRPGGSADHQPDLRRYRTVCGRTRDDHRSCAEPDV